MSAEDDESKAVTLPELLDQLPLQDRTRINDAYVKWYNLLIRLYKKHFDLEDADAADQKRPGGRDRYMRKFRDVGEVIIFFREAILWWHRRKPNLGELVEPLDAIKTWTCLGQIRALKDRCEAAGVEVGQLKIDENIGKPQRDLKSCVKDYYDNLLKAKRERREEPTGL